MNNGTTRIVHPNDTDAERELLASCFNSSNVNFDTEDAIKLVVTHTTQEHFAHPHHEKIWIALSEAVQDSGQGKVSWGDVRGNVDENSTARKTLRDIATNSSYPPASKTRMERIIGKLGEMQRSREILRLIERVKLDASVGLADNAYAALMDGTFAMARDRFSNGAQFIEHYADDVLADLTIRRNANGIVGLPTGMNPLDNVAKGLQKKQLILIGARPGNYKSVSAGQIAYAVSQIEGERSLICSPEMSAEQYMTRWAAWLAGVDYDDYNAGTFTDEEDKRLRAAVEHLREQRIIINESGAQDINDIRQDIIRYKPSVVIVDYLQLIDPAKKTGNDYQDVGAVSKALVEIKKDFKIPVVACVQLSRKVEERMPPRPISSDMRATGKLEQDADTIFMLYNAKEYATYNDMTGEYELNKEVIDPEKVEWLCTKNRHGRKVDVDMYVRDGQMHMSNGEDNG